MNQSRHRVFYEYLESKAKRFFAIACLFHGVKELSKSIQTRHGVCHEYLESKAKKFFGIACLGKKLGFHTENCDYF